jgi:hypothetical protein
LAFGVSVLLLSVGPLLLANSGLEEQHDAERALADLAQLEEGLDEALLRARGGWDTDWDRVVAVQRSLLEVQTALGPHLERWEILAKTSLRAPALVYLNASRERGHAIEGFKTEFSVLRNSLRYLPTVAREALRAEPGAENVDAKLAISIVDAMESALGTGSGGAASQLDRFAALGAGETSRGSALANLFRHAQIAVEKRETVDELLARALDPDRDLALERLRDRFDASLLALHRRRVISRAALSAIAVMLGGAVGYVSLRLRRGATMLADLNAQLERRVQERTVDLEREVVNRRAAEEQARRLALFDELTNLPNRRLLRERLDHTIP